jgi:hypothetical protein
MVNYQQFLSDLTPDFDDCPAPCKFARDEGRTIDLPDLCEPCEVRIQFNFFTEAARAELALRFGDEPQAWSFASLYDDVLYLMKLDRQLRGKGYPRGCGALRARALDVLRREQNRPRRIDLWELKQKAKGKGHG